MAGAEGELERRGHVGQGKRQVSGLPVGMQQPPPDQC